MLFYSQAKRALLLMIMLGLYAPGAHGLSSRKSEAEPSWNERWESVSQLRDILERTPSGRLILRKAKERDQEFLKKIGRGEASYTESTFVRSYSLLTGKEEISHRHEITLRSGHGLAEAVLDFAHELVHFAEKTMLDPYGPSFEKVEFIRHGIEGKGGELEAFLKECRVAQELREIFPQFPRHQLCDPFAKGGYSIDGEAARRAYYRVGKEWEVLPPLLLETLPELTAQQPIFTSSYARKPYPIALAEEFAETRKAACANNRRKYRMIAAQSTGAGRQLAQESLLTLERRRLMQYEKIYCSYAEEDTRHRISGGREGDKVF
jgi:hypothetical protein